MNNKFPFLSPEWETAADQLNQEIVLATDSSVDLSINVTVSPSPYGDKLLSIVSSEGKINIDKTHAEPADVSVKTDYETAYKLFMGADINLVLSAMLEGKLVVQGDIAKLMGIAATSQGSGAMPFPADLSQKIVDITQELEVD